MADVMLAILFEAAPCMQILESDEAGLQVTVQLGQRQ
jgi:hypothetical protein